MLGTHRTHPGVLESWPTLPRPLAWSERVNDGWAGEPLPPTLAPSDPSGLFPSPPVPTLPALNRALLSTAAHARGWEMSGHCAKLMWAWQDLG